MEFLFIVGRTHELASVELNLVLATRFPDEKVEFLTPSTAKVSLPSIEEARNLQNILGGTVKVAQIDKTLGELSHKELVSEISSLLQKLTPDGKNISFGLSEYGRENKPSLGLMEIKRELSSQGISSRFVEGPKIGLSASVLLHQNVDEILIVDTKTSVILGHTIAVQNIDEWSRRDRSKPFADRKHGMLPPKVARMMLNLAMPEGATGKHVLDPFCGTGTVVLEATMLGAVSYGTDIRQDAVDQTRGNLSWLYEKVLETSFDSNEVLSHIFLSDATKLTPEMLTEPIDAIVAEGFLGPLTPHPKKLDNIFKGVEKLYLGSFKQWTKILRNGAKICIALPHVDTGKRIYSLSGLIDSLGGLGYNSILTPQLYERPDATVKREIFILEFTK